MLHPNRPYKFILIPSRGDAVPSALFYPSVDHAAAIGSAMARRILNSEPLPDPVNRELRTLQALGQTDIEVAVIDRRNNTAVGNMIVRSAAPVVDNWESLR